MTRNIFLLAGEASGDALGAKLMIALKELDPDIKFSGVGGEQMEALGLESLFPMEELSLLGFTEIVPHIPHLLKRIEETADNIEGVNPDAVITIDAPAFNFRVAKKLKDRGNQVKRIHYVAPTVWAYKPKRAEKISTLYDHILVLLPFEPSFFEDVGLPCTFVGHPILEEDLNGGSGEGFRQKHGIYKKAKIVYMMPGSRKSEINRLLPVFIQTLEILHETIPDIYIVAMSVQRFEKDVEKELSKIDIPHVVISNPKEKKDALAASNVGLVKSGTGSLELAMVGLPMVVTYKVNPLSAWMLRRMIRVQYVNIVNLLLDAPVIPELLQEDCKPEYLSASLSSLLDDSNARQNQLINTQKAMQMLGAGALPLPSKKAAEVILNLI